MEKEEGFFQLGFRIRWLKEVKTQRYGDLEEKHGGLRKGVHSERRLH
jgi:hypothetical protein